MIFYHLNKMSFYLLKKKTDKTLFLTRNKSVKNVKISSAIRNKSGKTVKISSAPVERIFSLFQKGENFRKVENSQKGEIFRKGENFQKTFYPRILERGEKLLFLTKYKGEGGEWIFQYR